MISDTRIKKLKVAITAIQKEFQQACDSGKSFYFKKEILQRLKLMMNEMEQLIIASKRKLA